VTFKADLVFILTWGVQGGYSLYSNIKDEALEEVISAFVQDQIGRPDGGTVTTDKVLYTVKVGLRLEDDTFAVKHDCGSEAFMTGIVAGALRYIPKDLKNQSLAEYKT
jgi:hypothetical protein